MLLKKKNELFRLGSRAGVLDRFFAFNSFEKNFSVGNGQRFLKCGCKFKNCLGILKIPVFNKKDSNIYVYPMNYSY